VIKGEGGSLVGYRAAGVPGTVRGMELALKKYGSGKLTWAQLVEPARRLAANGFTVTYSLARSLHSTREYLSTYAETKRIYLRGGNFYKEGEIFRQPELAATFTRLQRLGPNEFYEGETARLIVADMKRNNGLMTMEDLRGYVAKERTPVRNPAWRSRSCSESVSKSISMRRTSTDGRLAARRARTRALR